MNKKKKKIIHIPERPLNSKRSLVVFIQLTSMLLLFFQKKKKKKKKNGASVRYIRRESRTQTSNNVCHPTINLKHSILRPKDIIHVCNPHQKLYTLGMPYTVIACEKNKKNQLVDYKVMQQSFV